MAANEAAPEGDDLLVEAEMAENPEQLPVAINEAGEQLLVPFVEQSVKSILPNGTRVPAMQIFDSIAANEMVAAHNSALHRLKRTITGLLGLGTAGVPIYYRHPDADPDHVDSREYGRAEDLRVGSDGLYGRMAYNEFGQRLLREVKGLRISPTWYLRPIPGDSSTPTRSRPRLLKSFGLTQFPNIPTAVAVNEHPTKKNMNQELIKALLAMLSFSNERIEATINGTPDAISITEVNNAFAPFQSASNEAPKIPDLEKQITDLQKQVTDLTAAKTAVETDLTAANEAINGYKGELAANEVEAALSAGKIAPSEKDARIKALVEAEDFAVACNELSGLEDGKALKVTSTTDALAQQQSQGLLAANEASNKFDELVRAEIASSKLPYDAAYAKVEQSTEGKQLVEAMCG